MQTFIQTPTPNVQDSLEFYSKLEFDIVSEEDPILVSDGKVLIEINPDRYARTGVKLLSPDWGGTVTKLKPLTSVMETDKGYLLADTSGMWIYLIETKHEFDFEPSEFSDSALGNNAGLSLETPGIEKSAELWVALGFTRSDPQWPSFTNSDQLTITLYKPNSCPHLFFNPSLTYFNGNSNLQVIEYIRMQNIPITEEITYFNTDGIADNVIIRDPGGLGFFIFND